MGAQSLRACLIEQLEFLRTHLVGAKTTPQAWYDEGADFAAIADQIDDLARESLAHAWGYLQGAADACDLTVMELLSEHSLTLDAPKRRASPHACPKCRGPSHQCLTGSAGCRHCDSEACGHSWRLSRAAAL